MYTVRFYNGTTLLQTVSVAYGGNATYNGDTPVNPEDSAAEFLGFEPTPTNVTADMDCYAQYKANIYTWPLVLSAVADGTYKDVYAIGDTVPLDLGSEGKINMQIAAFDTDDLADGSGKAAITWIAKELLATTHRMNPSLVTLYDYKEQPATGHVYNNTPVSANTKKHVSFNPYIKAGEVAETTSTVVATADGTLSILYSGIPARYGTLELLVNGETIVSDYASTTEVTHTVDVASGDTVTVVARFTSVEQTGTYAYVSLKSTGTFNLTLSCNNVETRYRVGYQDATGPIGGWEKTEMRVYLKETIKPLISEAVRNSIKEIKKTQTACYTTGAQFTQSSVEDVWVPSKAEMVGSTSKYYALFQNTGSIRIKSLIGKSDPNIWWLRDTKSQNYFNSISVAGNESERNSNSKEGVALCFCT
jgi:hypothetical protein